MMSESWRLLTANSGGRDSALDRFWLRCESSRLIQKFWKTRRQKKRIPKNSSSRNDVSGCFPPLVAQVPLLPVRRVV
jgi:hypothetical protein